MKKVSALGMVAITIAVNLIPMRAEAAGFNTNSQCYAGQKVVTINGNCSLEELQNQLKNAGVNANYADWASELNKKICQSVSDQQVNNTGNNVSPAVENSNQACDDTQLANAVKNAEVLQKQQDCNQQTQPASNCNTPSQADVADDASQKSNATPAATNNTDKVTTKETKTTNTPAENKTTTNTAATKDNAAKPVKTTTTPATTVDNTNASYAQQVVDLVNVERAKEGLAPLTIDERVAQAATVRAKEIQTKFAHVRPNGSGFVTALKEQGVTYRGAGENIAWGQRTPQEVVTAWMNSPGHRANIMNKNYVHIGVGNLQNSSGTQYWVQIFTY